MLQGFWTIFSLGAPVQSLPVVKLQWNYEMNKCFVLIAVNGRYQNVISPVPKDEKTSSKRERSRKPVFEFKILIKVSLKRESVCELFLEWTSQRHPWATSRRAKWLRTFPKPQWFQLTSITSCKLHFESSQSLNLLDKLHTQPIFCFTRIWHFWRRGRLIDASSVLVSKLHI